MKINPLHCIDFYKSGHIYQYPPGTEYVYSNLTPRSSINGETHVIWFGLQYFIKSFLVETWDEGFFKRSIYDVIEGYQRRMELALGPNVVGVEHIEALHILGYLPIEIKALPEGSLVPLKVPVLTIENTKPEFFWLTNYLETVMSNMLWKMSTSATTAYQFKALLQRYGQTSPFCCHDFSFRGMSSVEDAAMSGAAHLTSFYGTDVVPAIDLVEQYYGGDDIIGVSVPATEHSVMCAGSKEGEFETFKRLITEVYPQGIVSIVSDTWDLWKVIDEYIPALKDEIQNRDGMVVIRPDSGDPVGISLEAVSRLYKIMPGENGRMHKNLGLIYGDGITLDRCERILQGLKDRGLSPDNMVFGIGSYAYQYKTRDNLGWAVKATWVQIDGEGKAIQKDPITDDGGKKSASGRLHVCKYSGEYQLASEGGWAHINKRDELKTVFKDGKLLKEVTFKEIRGRINTYASSEKTASYSDKDSVPLGE